jgi:hypothetical protein
MNEKTLEVRGAPTRCPYCHEEATASADVLVCQDCLARHHAECWRERNACSSCSSTRRLEPPARQPLTVSRAREALIAAGFEATEVDSILRPAPVEVRGTAAGTIGKALLILMVGLGAFAAAMVIGDKFLSRQDMLPFCFAVALLASGSTGVRLVTRRSRH